MDDRERRGTDALAELACGEDLLAPVEGDADAQRWMDCDLASFAEHRCDELVEPATLDDARRTDLSRRSLAPDEDLADPRTAHWWLATFWIVDKTERLGTLAIARGSCWRFAPVSSLYVFPATRGRGTAYRALRGLQELAPRAGLHGIRLGTFWAWQANVRRYLYRYGMWACSFKRSIDFVWADLPRHMISIGDREACFAIERDGKRVELLRATHEGDRLGWEEMDATSTEREVGFLARATFSVALALAGWPLLRSRELFDDAAGADVGGPEVLARKIAVFEWLDRRAGFPGRQPRIPGLPYDEIASYLEGSLIP